MYIHGENLKSVFLSIRTKLVFLFLILIIVFLISGCDYTGTPLSQSKAPAATDKLKVYTLIAATNSPKVSGMYRGMEIFKEIVEEKTKGRVKVELYADGALGDEEQLAEAMQSGKVDFTIHSAAKYANFVPEMDIYSPPYTFKSWEHMKAVVHSEINDKLAELVKQRRGDLYVGVFTDGLRNVFTRYPVKTLDEMRGMKIRTMTGPNETKAWKALNTRPTPLSYPELYDALQTGAVDGAENTMTAILGMKFYESCRYALITGHNYLVLPVVLSGRFIEKLPKDLREPVIQSAREACKAQLDWAIEYDVDNGKLLKEKYGVTVYEFSKEDLNRAIELCKPVHDENARRIKMEKELEMIRELGENIQ